MTIYRQIPAGLHETTKKFLANNRTVSESLLEKLLNESKPHHPSYTRGKPDFSPEHVNEVILWLMKPHGVEAVQNATQILNRSRINKPAWSEALQRGMKDALQKTYAHAGQIPANIPWSQLTGDPQSDKIVLRSQHSEALLSAIHAAYCDVKTKRYVQGRNTFFDPQFTHTAFTLVERYGFSAFARFLEERAKSDGITTASRKTMRKFSEKEWDESNFQRDLTSLGRVNPDALNEENRQQTEAALKTHGFHVTRYALMKGALGARLGMAAKLVQRRYDSLKETMPTNLPRHLSNINPQDRSWAADQGLRFGNLSDSIIIHLALAFQRSPKGADNAWSAGLRPDPNKPTDPYFIMASDICEKSVPEFIEGKLAKKITPQQQRLAILLAYHFGKPKEVTMGLQQGKTLEEIQMDLENKKQKSDLRQARKDAKQAFLKNLQGLNPAAIDWLVNLTIKKQ